jgi:hypothetical protein
MTADTRADRHPGGRPTIGTTAKWALSAPLRAALAAARRTDPDGKRESEAAAARRLLAAALDPALPAALRMAANAYAHYAATDSCADCLGAPPDPWQPCPEHAAMLDRAAELRALADDLT